MKILIKNGTIVNGNNEPSFNSDILIEDQKIKLIKQEIDINDCKVIDATGKVICPGFIDTHSHSDLSVLVDSFNEVKVRQGITTEILGQDGLSMAPLPKEYINSWRKNIAPLNGESDDIDWEYENTKNYLNMMEEKGVGINSAYLLPHGNIRLEVMGLEAKTATDDEIKKMCEVTEREMQSGAIGVSSGLIYTPCVYSDLKEIIEICKVVKKYDGIFVVHQRSEADDIINSMKEIIEVSRQSGVKIHFSHFKVCGKANWKLIDEMLYLLDQCEKENISVSFDQYPYAAGCTSLGVVLPPWAHAGGTDKLLERLNDKASRLNMRKDIENGIPGWDNFIDFVGLDQIFVTSVKTSKNQDLVGKNLKEIGEIKNQDPIEATFDLLYEEKNQVSMVDFYGLEEHVIKFLKRKEQNVCTDGVLVGKPHPRAYSTFPKILGRYVREENILTLEEAIYKMTKKPAKTFNLQGRGVIKEGYYADIVVFNKERIVDTSDYIEPTKYPLGIDYVIVNGDIVLEDNEFYKINSGKVLRRR